MRLVLRWAGFGIPYPWFGFATRFKPSNEFVGADFFKEFARDGQASFIRRANAGLMGSFESLDSERFKASIVHPGIKDFYENTSSYHMELDIKWNPFIKPFGWLYRLLYANRIKQTMIPLDNQEFQGLDNWIETIDTDHDNKPEFRCWIRVTTDTGTPVYVGAYKVYQSQIDNFKASYVSVAFPIPGGSITTVLSPKNFEGNGLLLTTRNRESSEAGLYVIFPGKSSYSMIPALGLAEEFRLRPMSDVENPYIDVVHTCYWLGLTAFVMKYKISRIPEG